MAKGYLLFDIERLLTEYNVAASPDESALPEGMLKDLVQRFKVQLSDAVFRLRKEKQVCLLVEKYHRALVLLLDEFLLMQSPDLNMEPESFYGILNSMLLDMETRYSCYLNHDMELPPRYISLSRKDWPSRLNNLSKRFGKSNGKALFEVIEAGLLRFIETERHHHLTLRALLYRKELIFELELLCASSKIATLPASLHQLLVYSNYNSRSYVTYYSMEITQSVNALPSGEKQYYLLRHYKKFQKLYCNTRIGLHPDKENVRDMVAGWYELQLVSLKNGGQAVTPFERSLKSVPPAVKGPVRKIVFTLTANQIGIILRAADRAGILKASSLSSVFKSVIPHIATANNQELSVASLRSKSYVFDEREREETIATLLNLVEKVRQL